MISRLFPRGTHRHGRNSFSGRCVPFSILTTFALQWVAGCASRGDLDVLADRVAVLEAQAQAQAQDTQVQRALADLDSTQASLWSEVRSRSAEDRSRSGDFAQQLSALSARLEALDSEVRDMRSGLIAVPLAQVDTLAWPILEAAGIYRQAYLDVTRGEFALAQDGFETYLASAPSGPLSDDARYWLGECHFAQGRYDQALDIYRQVTRLSPQSEWGPASLLKAGLSYLKLGLKVEARAALQRVVDEFPETEDARVATERLRDFDRS